MRAVCISYLNIKNWLQIINTETEERLGPNQYGEIRFKSPAFMKGYIGIYSSTYLDKEGFFKSGDYGYYDDDGCVFFVGRLKEIIKYDGYPVSIKDTQLTLYIRTGLILFQRKRNFVTTNFKEY